MSFYSEMAQVATDLLTEYGAPVVMTRTDTVTGVATSITVIGVFVDPVSHRLHPSELESPDKRLISRPGEKILEGDAIVRSDGTRLIVYRVEEIRPADVVLCYKSELRYG